MVANKTLVNTTVEKLHVKILSDTGAEINVIDENFLKNFEAGLSKHQGAHS
jgi:hypothetical protein